MIATLCLRNPYHTLVRVELSLGDATPHITVLVPQSLALRLDRYWSSQGPEHLANNLSLHQMRLDPAPRALLDFTADYLSLARAHPQLLQTVLDRS